MEDIPDLVRDSMLDTFFDGDYHLHRYDSDDEIQGQSTRRWEYWEDRGKLAEGGFGKIHLQECVEGRGKGGMRAVKVLSKSKSAANKIDYVNELEAIAKFSQKRYSRCFAKLIGWYDDDDDVFIAMEYFPLGDLQVHMTANPPMCEDDVQNISYQILEGLNYMHQQGFAHRDVKPANILIKSQPPNHPWRVKISDFGISKRIYLDNTMVSTIKGSPVYMAPELRNYEPGSNVVIDYQATDVWSMGEMVYRMLTKSAALFTPHDLSGYLAGPGGRGGRQVGALVLDFIQSLRTAVPEHRLTSRQALDHEWLLPLAPAGWPATPASGSFSRSMALTAARRAPGSEMGEWATASRTDLSMVAPSNQLQPGTTHSMADASSSAYYVRGSVPSQGLALGRQNGVSQILDDILLDPKVRHQLQEMLEYGRA